MGLIVGIPASVTMTELMIRGNEPERIYDRCFRLRHNQCQQVNKSLDPGYVCPATPLVNSL